MPRAGKARTAISRAGRAPDPRRAAGFTLVELLVVMLVMVLVIGVATPFLARSVGKTNIDAVARELAAALRETRAEAIRTGGDAVFVVDTGEGSYRVGDGAPAPFPEDLRVELVTAQSELIDDTSGRIRFFRDGTATGGSVVLSEEDRALEVSVIWLTGRVRIAEEE